MGEKEDDHPTEAWADILARGSPEDRALELRLDQAEESAIEAQRQALRAIEAGRPETLKALDDAMAEVARLRNDVYRMVRQ